MITVGDDAFVGREISDKRHERFLVLLKRKTPIHPYVRIDHVMANVAEFTEERLQLLLGEDAFFVVGRAEDRRDQSATLLYRDRAEF